MAYIRLSRTPKGVKGKRYNLGITINTKYQGFQAVLTHRIIEVY